MAVIQWGVNRLPWRHRSKLVPRRDYQYDFVPGLTKKTRGNHAMTIVAKYYIMLPKPGAIELLLLLFIIAGVAYSFARKSGR